MNRLDRFPTDVESSSAGTISLGDSTVESGKAFQVDLHPRTEGRVQGIPGHIRARSVSIVHLIVIDLPQTPEGITPTFRGSDDFEGRRAGGLDLVCHITVPEF